MSEDEILLSEKSILLQLRESAMLNSNEQYRETARTCADHLDVAIKKFAHAPTFTNLVDVNGLTALAYRIMDKLQPGNGSPGQGGAMREEVVENLKVAV